MSSKQTESEESGSQSTYSQGHSAAVLISHSQRTVANSAAFLLPHLQPHFSILDVGCGPGTITCGFTSYVPQGRVLGIDLSPDVISHAQSLHPPSKYPNLTFAAANILSGLPPEFFPDSSFDVVFTHQTILHLPDPVAAMREAHRVLKPGGLLAMREADHLTWYPLLRGLELCNDATQRNITSRGAPGFNRSRELHVWAGQAGFERQKMLLGAGTTVFASPEERRWWADAYGARLRDGEDFLKKVKDMGMSTEDVEMMRRDLAAWAEDENGWHAALQCEAICQK